MKLASSAALLAAALCSPAWAANCTTTHTDLGVLTSGQMLNFGSRCDMVGLDRTDADQRSFRHTLNFTMAQAGNFFGDIDLHYTINADVDPSHPQPGQPHYIIDIANVLLEGNGIRQFIGGETVGHYERARIVAHGLAAGSYTATLYGSLFNLGAAEGFYTANVGATYTSVAAPVPEPATYALVLLGAPLAGWAAKRRRRQGADAVNTTTVG